MGRTGKAGLAAFATGTKKGSAAAGHAPFLFCLCHFPRVITRHQPGRALEPRTSRVRAGLLQDQVIVDLQAVLVVANATRITRV